jgi:hypothetical protein
VFTEEVRLRLWKPVAALVAAVLALSVCTLTQAGASTPIRTYRWHRNIVSTTFWVGEIFDPNASDGSQVISTYDSHWMRHFGGCDGVKTAAGGCETQKRTAANKYFPTAMKPKQNPFYLDLPFDDVNDPKAFAARSRVVPWAHDPSYAKVAKNPNYSLMKNRWVEITHNGHTCYGQIEDAGPGQYHDAAYVFGTAKPANARYGGAGMDVSPALNGCLRFAELNGDTDRVNWRFVERRAVPPGPWTRLITKSGLDES